MASLLKQWRPLLRNFNASKITVQGATIISKACRDPNYSRLPPYPYETKNYSNIDVVLDKTYYRFDENTALIVVEGPMGCGKNKLAKQVAELLDFKFMPDWPISMAYNLGGYDLTLMDNDLPHFYKSMREPDFHCNPRDVRTHWYQHRYLLLRWHNYCDSLLHLLSTGQGVVMTRSALSNYVYVDTMIHLGLLNSQYRVYYDEVSTPALCQLWRPHIVVYLDTPYASCKERIKKRGRDYEQNSEFLTEEAHNYMDYRFKKSYLPKMAPNSHLLLYDWTEEGDADDVVYDIERLPWPEMRNKFSKFKDWKHNYESHYCALRRLVSDYRDHYTGFMVFIEPIYVPEMYPSSEDCYEYGVVFDKHSKSYRYDKYHDPKKVSYWKLLFNMGPDDLSARRTPF